MEPAYFRSQRHVLPEARIVRDLFPAFAYASNSAYLAVREVTEYVQKNFVRQLFYRLQRKDILFILKSMARRRSSYSELFRKSGSDGSIGYL